MKKKLKAFFLCRFALIFVSYAVVFVNLYHHTLSTPTTFLRDLQFQQLHHSTLLICGSRSNSYCAYMDFFESTDVVFKRIEKLEPQNVSKIVGHLLLRDHPHLEMIRLAFCSDHTLQLLIHKLNLELHLSPKPLVPKLPATFTPFTPPYSCFPPHHPAPQNGVWNPQVPNSHHLSPLSWFNSAALEYGLGYPFGSSILDGPYYQNLDFRPPRLPEFGMQVCNSFRQGYCKYGGSCKFLHVFQMQNGDCMVLNPPLEDEIMSSGALKHLEIEIIKLLRSTQGIPISVSSLPILYFDRYGKVLQVEGWQTDSHRQGRLTSRMIQLLARMPATAIRVTNRPHRRQSIILDEDMNRYAKFRLENEDELQVYLTFPPENILSEQDVYNYFNCNFGPVQEVRIPIQMHRMFGFITFVYPETAALILTKLHPHYICGTQVLVKPYQLTPMLDKRKTEEKVHDQLNYDPVFVEAESKLVPTLNLEESEDLLGKPHNEEHKEESVNAEKEVVNSCSDYFSNEIKVRCKNEVER